MLNDLLEQFAAAWITRGGSRISMTLPVAGVRDDVPPRAEGPPQEQTAQDAMVTDAAAPEPEQQGILATIILNPARGPPRAEGSRRPDTAERPRAKARTNAKSRAPTPHPAKTSAPSPFGSARSSTPAAQAPPQAKAAPPNPGPQNTGPFGRATPTTPGLPATSSMPVIDLVVSPEAATGTATQPPAAPQQTRNMPEAVQRAAGASTAGAGIEDRLFLRMLEDLDSLSEVQLRLLYQAVRRTCHARSLRLIIAHDIPVQTDTLPVAPGAQGDGNSTTATQTDDPQPAAGDPGPVAQGDIGRDRPRGLNSRAHLEDAGLRSDHPIHEDEFRRMLLTDWPYVGREHERWYEWGSQQDPTPNSVLDVRRVWTMPELVHNLQSRKKSYNVWYQGLRVTYRYLPKRYEVEIPDAMSEFNVVRTTFGWPRHGQAWELLEDRERAETIGAIERRIIVAVIVLQPAASWERVYKGRCAALPQPPLSICATIVLGVMCHAPLHAASQPQCMTSLCQGCISCHLLDSHVHVCHLTGVSRDPSRATCARSRYHMHRCISIGVSGGVPPLYPPPLVRMIPHRGERIGEASHPGPEKRKHVNEHTVDKRPCPANSSEHTDDTVRELDGHFVPTTQDIDDLRACLASPSSVETSSMIDDAPLSQEAGHVMACPITPPYSKGLMFG